MSKVFVVGYGLNVQGIFDNAEDAEKAAINLPAVEINNTTVQATVMQDDANKYHLNYDKGIATAYKGDNTYYLNSTIEANKW